MVKIENNDVTDIAKNALTIKIKYFDNEIDKIKKINQGDLIDLRIMAQLSRQKFDIFIMN